MAGSRDRVYGSPVGIKVDEIRFQQTSPLKGEVILASSQPL
jgi:hypothetical protein